jgi:hypothetical protein
MADRTTAEQGREGFVGPEGPSGVEVEAAHTKRFANCTQCSWTRDLSITTRWMDSIASHVARLRHTVVVLHIDTRQVVPTRPAETVDDPEVVANGNVGGS